MAAADNGADSGQSGCTMASIPEGLLTTGLH